MSKVCADASELTTKENIMDDYIKQQQALYPHFFVVMVELTPGAELLPMESTLDKRDLSYFIDIYNRNKNRRAVVIEYEKSLDANGKFTTAIEDTIYKPIKYSLDGISFKEFNEENLIKDGLNAFCYKETNI